MTSRDLAPSFTRTPHLVDLVAEVERLATLIGTAAPARREEVAAALHADAALATLRLDGSPIERPPREATSGPRPTPTGSTSRSRPGTWLDGLGAHLESAADEELTALEYAGVMAALASDDLADGLLTDLVPSLGELHRRLTRGLVAPEHAGAPRRTDQAVQDASVGRILYFPADPRDVVPRLNQLAVWLASTAAREHGLVVSGLLHLELLRIHPFEAANGRLARAAARLVLRARRLDPGGLAVSEPLLQRDAIGYHEEVARTTRRRDETIWLERWGEAVAAGLRLAADRLDLLDPTPTARGRRFLDGLAIPTFTVVDYRASAPAGPEEARTDLAALLDAGAIERVPGGRGLRFRVRPGRSAPAAGERPGGI